VIKSKTGSIMDLCHLWKASACKSENQYELPSESYLLLSYTRTNKQKFTLILEENGI